MMTELDAWPDRAACKGTDIHLMPDQRRHPSHRQQAQISQAIAVCHICPVITECRAWVLSGDDPLPAHVAGGLTPNERTALRSQRWQGAA